MSNSTSNLKGFSQLTPEAIKDFKKLNDKYPDAIKNLTSYPGQIGELAKLSLQCGGGDK